MAASLALTSVRSLGCSQQGAITMAPRMRRTRAARAATAAMAGLLLLALTPLTSAQAAEARSMPTAEECAAGGSNGAHLGRHIGAAAVCLAAEGHTVGYAGGRLAPPFMCGSVTLGDQPIFDDDPNECDAFGPAGGTTLRFRIQLPSRYHETDDRYPVLYLLPGGEGNEDRWFELDPQLPALADQGVIIVSVFNEGGFYNDWHNGEHKIETLYTDTLIGFVDAEFRTVAERAFRAVAGVSEGGYGAMLFAARHPDLYVAAASFSGPVDITDPAFAGPGAVAHATGFLTYDDPLGTFFPIFGDPARDQVRWRGRNPTELVANLAGVTLLHTAGDGVPTAADLADQGPGAIPAGTTERLIRRMNDNFDHALHAASVPHTYATRQGVHDSGHAVDELHHWFPTLLDTFGRPDPTSFDHRSIDPAFSVWGWDFKVDADRAAEFLEVRGASASGVTLTGSGLTTITTAAHFQPGSTVALDGATAPAAKADDEGRITFTVDLGEAHSTQQYTVPQLAAEAAAGRSYFTSATVRFRP